MESSGQRRSRACTLWNKRINFRWARPFEIMKPDGRNIPVTVERIRDLEGNEMDSAPHARQQLLVGLQGKAEPYDILRRREADAL